MRLQCNRRTKGRGYGKPLIRLAFKREDSARACSSSRDRTASPALGTQSSRTSLVATGVALAHMAADTSMEG